MFQKYIKTINHKEYTLELENKNIPRLVIVTSGYERRSSSWAEQTIKKMRVKDDGCIVIGFEDFKDTLSRCHNDDYYRQNGFHVEIINSWNLTEFTEKIEFKIQKFLRNHVSIPTEIHVDYSCMPRLWYCALPELIKSIIGENDQVYFWYSPGEYPEADYPSAGIEDFKIFSGKPSLGTKMRTHIFGLGFDRIRSKAIWSVLDPQNLICFYADPGTKPEYVDRVKKDNEDLIRESKSIFTVPISDFVYCYSAIKDIVREYARIGDVILVPDGPKPLVLASSMIPYSIEADNGIVCFHVSRRKPEDFIPVEVLPYGDPIGFTFKGDKQ
jgi:hypothetical protein